MIRAQAGDVDFRAGVITLHEGKGARGKRTTPRVPLSTPLTEVLTDWIGHYRGGSHLFCRYPPIARGCALQRS
jgi:hypothetical protein